MDRKFRFFKNVVLLQFVLVFLLGVLILMNFREQKLLNIRGLHPFEFNYAHALPIIFFGVCFLISVLIVFLKEQNGAENEVDEQKKIRRQNFWKFAFYSNVFFLLICAVFSVALFRKDPFIIDEPVYFYSLVFARSLLVVLISLVTASFLLTSGIYWKSNRTMGIIILFFSFLIVCFSLFYEAVFVIEFWESSEIYVTQRNENQVSSSVAQTAEYSEESEEIDPETEKSKLISSWNSLIEDWVGLEDKYQLSDLRILIGRNLDTHIIHYYYFVDYIDGLRGNPDELYAGFVSYKSVFYNLVSPNTYYKTNFDKIVDGLLLTYNDLGQEEAKLNEIYKFMDVSNKKSQPYAESYFSDLEQYFSPETIQELKSYKLSNYDDDSGNIIWFYSFWARRNHEGNAKEVAKILNEIKEHYNQNLTE